MVERLTEKDSIDNKRYMLNSEDNTVCVTNVRLNNYSTIAYCWGKPIDKLAQLEDILEKYDIEYLEQYLLKMRKVDKELRDTIQQLHTIIDSIGYDRDNWQKACELACKECNKLSRYDEIIDELNFSPYTSDYFYQQAKTEGNDNENNM